jgi:drug/metabolite transporter (DMT)-like permease
LGAFLTGNLPALTLGGLVYFLLAGVTNSLVGRWAWIESARTLGPSRGSALKVSSPVFAATLAFFVLGEPLTPIMFGGILATLAGVVVLTLEANAQRAEATVVRATAGGAAVLAHQRPRLSFPTLSNPAVMQGVMLGLAAAFSYACGSVLRKLGLGTVPSPFLGAFIGSFVAVGAVTVGDGMRGLLVRRFHENFRSLVLPFVLSGFFVGVAQLSSFAALQYTTVANASTIGAAEPLFAALLSVLVFRNVDVVTGRSIAGMLAICAGVGVVVFR